MKPLYPKCSHTYLAILDSGCSQHFLQNNKSSFIKQQLVTPIPVTLPNGTVLHATHCTQLQLKHVPKAAIQALILPTLTQYSLLLISQFCDAGCTETFTSTTVSVTYNNHTIVTGLKNQKDGLYYTLIQEQPKNCDTTATTNMRIQNSHNNQPLTPYLIYLITLKKN